MSLAPNQRYERKSSRFRRVPIPAHYSDRNIDSAFRSNGWFRLAPSARAGHRGAASRVRLCRPVQCALPAQGAGVSLPVPPSMPLYAATIFFSAFLLFLLQPITAKQILPWFGGSAAVWTTCLVFFQTALTAGYAYADAVARRLSPSRQALLHSTLLVASLVALPIVPAAFWKPTGSENPLALILGLLAVTLGLPYFLLSTTSPLLQAWFARRFPGRDPYRLFALSNVASLVALLAYPFAIEPWIATRSQAYAWSATYALFVVLCIATAWRNRGAVALSTPNDERASELLVAADRDAPSRPGADGFARAPTLARQLLWCSLAATGSVLLLA